jgi:hypothetical protein
MPAVNYDLMCQEMLKLGGRPNQIVYWSRLPDWKNQTAGRALTRREKPRMVEANCKGFCSRSLQRMSNHARGSLEPGSIMRKLSIG